MVVTRNTGRTTDIRTCIPCCHGDQCPQRCGERDAGHFLSQPRDDELCGSKIEKSYLACLNKTQCYASCFGRGRAGREVVQSRLGMQAPLEPGGLCCDRDGHGDRQADLELRASRATDPHINHSHGPFNTRNPNITPVLNK
ncbi:unnamed protein product [Arctogadus glacialis]